MGSPAINQFKGKIIKDKSDLYFNNGDFKVKIPDVAHLKKYIGKEVIMGIRPEDIYDSAFDQMAEFPQKIEALCEVVEPMGNEFIVFLATEKSKITARFDPKKYPEIDAKLTITFDMKKAHFFDTETEGKI